MRVTQSRELVAEGYKPAVVARVSQISRQAIYRIPKTRPATHLRKAVGDDPIDRVITEVAKSNPTDGTRMVAALASRKAGCRVNRKRVQRVMRQTGQLQRHRPLGRRKRPGYFMVRRPRELWHMDFTSIWVAEHGWCYLNAIIDCCTREIPGWSLDIRCRTEESKTTLDQALQGTQIQPAELTLGTDNGSCYTSRAFKTYLKTKEVTHRRGGYRDPESQAFIESWFSKLKERLIWRTEFETLDQARKEISNYINTYHHRPHSGLNYKTPAEVAQTWHDATQQQKSAT